MRLSTTSELDRPLDEPPDRTEPTAADDDERRVPPCLGQRLDRPLAGDLAAHGETRFLLPHLDRQLLHRLPCLLDELGVQRTHLDVGGRCPDHERRRLQQDELLLGHPSLGRRPQHGVVRVTHVVDAYDDARPAPELDVRHDDDRDRRVRRQGEGARSLEPADDAMVEVRADDEEVRLTGMAAQLADDVASGDLLLDRAGGGCGQAGCRNGALDLVAQGARSRLLGLVAVALGRDPHRAHGGARPDGAA